MNFCHDIAHMTAWRFGLTLADLRGLRRNKRLIPPRHLAMHLCRELTDYSTTQIGRALNRDHSTVLVCGRKMGARLSEDEELAQIAGEITASIILFQKRTDLPLAIQDRRRVIAAEQATAQALEAIAILVGRARTKSYKPVYGCRACGNPRIYLSHLETLVRPSWDASDG